MTLFFVNLIYFLETADKIATTAFLRMETITHFYREQQQYLDHLKKVAAVTAALHNLGSVLRRRKKLYKVNIAVLSYLFYVYASRIYLYIVIFG